MFCIWLHAVVLSCIRMEQHPQGESIAKKSLTVSKRHRCGHRLKVLQRIHMTCIEDPPAALAVRQNKQMRTRRGVKHRKQSVLRCLL